MILSAPRLTVSALSERIRDRLESDEVLQDLWLEGEVSQMTRSTAGHIYFTLKDDQSCISCVVWRSAALGLACQPSVGASLLARGHVSTYAPRGTYQFYVQELAALGAGALYMEFERLKARLAAEGLFDPSRKRALPACPRAIGVVTSAQAAAYQDILKVLRGRYPLARVVLAATAVQGEPAPAQICEALRGLNAQRAALEIDVIIVARGGGSLEDLWAFNDERVARAIAASETPVVSGVGHEIDFTIADFAADLRAPTPTAAASAVVPDFEQLQRRFADARAGLVASAGELLGEWQATCNRLRERLGRAAPRTRVDRDRQRVDDLRRRLALAGDHRLAVRREQVSGRLARLRGLDPQAVLNRGYAIVCRRDTGVTVSRLSQVEDRPALDIRVKDGAFGAHTDPAG